MCEIAVFDPEQASDEAINQTAARFHEEQGDGIGLLAVQKDGEQFNYETYKSTKPHWQTFNDFLTRHRGDTWRFVLHGRAGTCGGVNRDSAHPIHVDCQHCEYDYVIHNGSVRNHRKIRAGLTSAGHDFSTKVDSEVLAHKVSELPDTVEDHDRSTYDFRGNLNYLLFSEDGIFIRVSSKYHLSEQFTMTCSLRKMDDYEDLGFERNNDIEWMLLTPNSESDGVSAETKERSYTAGNSRHRVGSAYRSGGTTASPSQPYGSAWEDYENNARTESDDEESTHVIEYQDLADEFEFLKAIQVAPGVIKLIDNRKDTTSYVFRRDEPRLYYWYSDEPEPDNISELEELADEGIKFEEYDRDGHSVDVDKARRRSDEQEALGFDELERLAAVQDSTAMVLEDETELSMGEAAEVADDVVERIAATEQ